MAVPKYVVDAPGGGGKIPVMPNYIVSWSADKVVLRNYEGVITTYTEPDNYKAIAMRRRLRKMRFGTENWKTNKKTLGVAKIAYGVEKKFP